MKLSNITLALAMIFALVFSACNTLEDPLQEEANQLVKQIPKLKPTELKEKIHKLNLNLVLISTYREIYT